jgi:hypothetical protein
MFDRAGEPNRRKRHQCADFARRSGEGTFPFAPGHAANESALAQSADRSIFVNAERLVQVWSRRERQIAELSVSRRNMERACVFLARPTCSHALGFACLEIAVKAHARCLEQLRASRREARKLVLRVDADLGPERNRAV